jgi:hypothetical protein
LVVVLREVEEGEVVEVVGRMRGTSRRGLEGWT